MLCPHPYAVLEQIIAASHRASLLLPKNGAHASPEDYAQIKTNRAGLTSREEGFPLTEPRRRRLSVTAETFAEHLKRHGRVKVPWRLISSPAAPDIALSVYIKVGALSARAEGCTAGVGRLAEYLRTSTSSVERGLRALSLPDPFDGVVELSRRRRTKPGGEGTTALRRPRPLARGERFVWVPVALVEVLEPRQLRAWAALAYAAAMGVPVSERELGELLVHHSGKRAGEAIGAAAASAVVDSLEALGLLLVHRRAGYQGRHEYVVLDRPPMVVPDQESNTVQAEAVGEEEISSSVGDASGSGLGDGSLANTEDSKTGRHNDDGAGGVQPAVGEVQVGSREAPVDNPGASNADPVGSPGVLALRAGGQAPDGATSQVGPQEVRRGYDGPELTYSARMAWITEPVRWLLACCRPYVQRQLARDLSGQMALGIEAERLRERLERRFAASGPSEIRNPGGWLLKVAAVRWGCHNPKCESGVFWATGEPCLECRAVREERRRSRLTEAVVAAGACPGCAASQGPCPMCELEAAPPAPAEPRMSDPGADMGNEPYPGPVCEVLDEREQRVPYQCPGCRSWSTGRGPAGRCRPCELEHGVGQAVTEAMDGAGMGLSGRAKIATAMEAGADVREAVDRARAKAVAQGLDGDELCWAVLGVAQTRAAAWIKKPGAEQ